MIVFLARNLHRNKENSLHVENKTFFFDIGNNNRGSFLRISEVTCWCVLKLFCDYKGRRSYLSDTKELSVCITVTVNGNS